MSEFNVVEKMDDDSRVYYQIVGSSGVIAYMKFSRLAKTLILHHTEVKPLLRGKGAAGELLKYSVKDAHRHGLKITALCPYSRKKLEGDPQYKDVY